MPAILLADLAALAPGFFKALGLGLFLPLLSDNMVRMPWRVGFALWLALLYAPLGPDLTPDLDWSAIIAGFAEGVLIGMIGRLMLMVFQVAGSVISTMSGLQQAVIFNPAEAQQTTSLELVLYFISVKLFIDHGIMALLLSSTMPLTQLTAGVGSDATSLIVSLFATSLRSALEIAAPFIVLNIAFTIGLGAANMLLPSLPLFMIGQPIQITATLLLLAAILGDGALSTAIQTLSTHFGLTTIGP